MSFTFTVLPRDPVQLLFGPDATNEQMMIQISDVTGQTNMGPACGGHYQYFDNANSSLVTTLRRAGLPESTAFFARFIAGTISSGFSMDSP